jgi:polyisoprenoid-binding protein YceI
MSWQIDPAHSHVYFSVRHMMISKVRGSFGTFSGTVNFDEQNPTQSSVEIVLDATSIQTQDEKRDGHLKSPDFFNVAAYPIVTFKSKRVEQLDAKHGRVVGDLTIRDITKEVELSVVYAGTMKSPWGTTSAGFSATTAINRKEWDLNWNQALETGGVLVGDTINIEIELELIKQPETVVA